MGLLLGQIPLVDSVSADGFSLITRENHEGISIWLKLVESKLPPAMKEGIGKTVQIQFEPMNDYNKRPVYGQVISPNKIRLNSNLISEINRNSNLAAATLIHELGHLYDDPTQDWNKARVSSNRTYQRLAGWSKQGPLRKLKPKNNLKLRSPNPYEFSEIREHFAVNLEHFLLDPEYSCRRPALNHYLVTQFGGFQPPSECQTQTQIFPHSKSGGLRLNQPIDINPKRIYEIHYLMASPGQGIESQFGHSMLRLVICAPSRSQVGPDCLKDVSNHLVVSYRAQVQESTPKVWKGIVGMYPSEAFFYPLKEMIEYYTKLELRDLESLPLKLDLEQKNQLVYRLLEQYWEYVGTYLAFKNNCSTEVGHLLKGVLPQEKLRGFSAKTPTQLKNKLIALGLLPSDLDESIRKSPAQTVKSGYLFRSSETALNDALKNLKDAFASDTKAQGIAIPPTLIEYFNSLADERLLLFQSIENSLRDVENLKKVSASFYYLESYLDLRKSQSLTAQIHVLLERDARKQKQSSSHIDPLIESVDTENPRPFPAYLLSSGYGVPLQKDFPSTLDANLGEKKDSGPALQIWIKENFPNATFELEKIQKNKKLFFSKLTAPSLSVSAPQSQ